MRHIEWLVDSGIKISTIDGRTVEVFDFNHLDDAAIMSEWAKHFRNHYCSDNEIDVLRRGTGKSRSEFLLSIKFPDKKLGFGPGLRSGDFGEILIADFLEFVKAYWVPRTRYSNKTIRNESTKGADIIGFKYKVSPEVCSKDDELIVFEAKAQLSGNSPKARLNDAIEGSLDDPIRLGESLNAIKQRLMDTGQATYERIDRFQDIVDNPFEQIFGAAAIFTEVVFDQSHIATSTQSKHPPGTNSKLLVVKGIGLMELVHKLYKLASDEA